MSVSFRAKGSADALFAVEFLDQIYVGAKISLGALFGGVAGAAEQRRKHNARRQCRAGGCQRFRISRKGKVPVGNAQECAVGIHVDRGNMLEQVPELPTRMACARDVTR